MDSPAAEARFDLQQSGRLLFTRRPAIAAAESDRQSSGRQSASAPLQGRNAYLLLRYTDAIKSEGFAIDHVMTPMNYKFNIFLLAGCEPKVRWPLRFKPPAVPDVFLFAGGASRDAPKRLNGADVYAPSHD